MARPRPSSGGHDLDDLAVAAGHRARASTTTPGRAAPSSQASSEAIASWNDSRRDGCGAPSAGRRRRLDRVGGVLGEVDQLDRGVPPTARSAGRVGELLEHRLAGVVVEGACGLLGHAPLRTMVSPRGMARGYGRTVRAACNQPSRPSMLARTSVMRRERNARVRPPAGHVEAPGRADHLHVDQGEPGRHLLGLVGGDGGEEGRGDLADEQRLAGQHHRAPARLRLMMTACWSAMSSITSV